MTRDNNLSGCLVFIRRFSFRKRQTCLNEMNVYTNTYVILKILYSNIVLLMFLNQKINIIPTANIISFFQYFENIITHHFDLSLNYNLQHTILALLG